MSQKPITKTDLYSHETKRSTLVRFLLVVFVLVAYFLLMSLRYGAGQGLSITFLTWSFFVLCTPIADAGFLLDFPLRLILKIRMLHAEIVVWAIAISLSSYFFFFNHDVFSKTFLLNLFEHILAQPIPFYAIIIVSAIGTFLSVYFGDELMDVIRHKEREKHAKHKNKHRMIIFVFVLVTIIFLYDYLLKKLGVDFKTF